MISKLPAVYKTANYSSHRFKIYTVIHAQKSCKKVEQVKETTALAA